MKAFDFDGTLYDGDSSLDFWLFALRENPRCILSLPSQIGAAIRYVAGRTGIDEFKSRFFSFVSHINEIEPLVIRFWSQYNRKLMGHVTAKVDAGDCIISASPAFLLSVPANSLHCRLIATNVDSSTGALIGPNCKGEEKVRRCIEEGVLLPFKEFYTDSKSDLPLCRNSRESFMVSGRAHELARIDIEEYEREA